MRGGGGSGNGSGGAPVSNNPPATPDLAIPSVPSSAPPIANIARARPRPGSVTQSSKIGGNGITLDQITLTDRSNFTLSNKDNWSINFTDVGDVGSDLPINSIVNTESIQESMESLRYLLPYGFNKTFITRDPYEYRLSKEGVIEYNNLKEVLGWYRETDYLTLGYWMVSDRVVIDTEDYRRYETALSDIGSFVTGGDLFNDNNMPIEGEATYQGLGIILAYENLPKYIATSYKGGDLSDTTNYAGQLLKGDSSLSVDFGTGTISGIISNFYGTAGQKERKSGEDPEPNRDFPGELSLNNAKIGSNNSGFFEGNLTGTLDGRSYNGLYGGQFYGNGESDGKPGTVAGTLGGISSDGRFTIMGPWFGDK